MEYQVIWTIEVDADSHEEAARNTLEIQRDPRSTATVFEVRRIAPGVIDRRTIDLKSDEGGKPA